MVYPFRSVSAFTVGGVLLVSGARAASSVDFGRDIQPILAEHCFHCHGQDEAARKGKLRLDQREAALKGGGSGEPAIVAGNLDKSALIERILSKDEDEVMPPPEEKKPVKAADVAKLKQWITEGAPYAEHWAFKAPSKPSVPAVKDVTHPLDAFIRARLGREGLEAAPMAAPNALSSYPSRSDRPASESHRVGRLYPGGEGPGAGGGVRSVG
jgi:hypothetical protein